MLFRSPARPLTARRVVRISVSDKTEIPSLVSPTDIALFEDVPKVIRITRSAVTAELVPFAQDFRFYVSLEESTDAEANPTEGTVKFPLLTVRMHCHDTLCSEPPCAREVNDWRTCDCDLNGTTTTDVDQWWNKCSKKALPPGTQRNAFVEYIPDPQVSGTAEVWFRFGVAPGLLEAIVAFAQFERRCGNLEDEIGRAHV